MESALGAHSFFRQEIHRSPFSGTFTSVGS